MSNLIEVHPSWQIIDSTKLQAFQTCPRKYFYEYILGWRPETPNHHLHFGSAMHKALEYIHQHPESYEDNKHLMFAFTAFLDEWRKFFPESCDDMFWPKSPMVMLQALAAYVQKWSSDPQDFRVLYTEISGSAPISEDRVIHFRMDTIIEDLQTRMKGCLEHKSASSDWLWEAQWPLKIQVGTYSHVLHCLFQPDEIGNVIMNGIFFKKNKTNTVALHRLPIYRTQAHLQQWLWTVNLLVDQIEYETSIMLDGKWEDPSQLFEAFPLCGESCIKYGVCPFHDFCCAWSNPLARSVSGPPPGFTQEYWDPRVGEATTRMDLTTGKIEVEMKP